MRRLVLAAVVAVSVVLVMPAIGAQAATRTVYAGPAGTAKGTFGGNSSADLDSFSVPRTTIHVGDRIRWIIKGVHTVTFNKKGGGRLPFVVNNPGAPLTGFNDAAGNPFWFNGQPQPILDPRSALPQGGKTYNGSAITGSGFSPPNAPVKPYVLKFTKTGTFRYFCVVHPGMNGTVRVVPKRKRIPTARQFAKETKSRLAAQAKTAKQLATYTPPAGTVVGGHDKGQVVQLRFFPASINVPVGGTVTFQVTSRAEVHTASFGDSAYLGQQANAIITPIGAPPAPPTLQFNPVIVFPSDPPPTLPPYTGAEHGNGFLSTGILDGDPASPSGTTSRITFNKAGTYQFICLVHPFMKAAVVVG